MKRSFAIIVTILFVMAGCGGNKQSTDALISVDVSVSYPKKELILQELMDVEYIPLETTDEFLTQGLVQDVGKEYLLIRNWINDGNIFIFDRKTGKALRKINRQGQGAEEYPRLSSVILDEANGEILVKSAATKILVYDLHGKYKRSLNLSQETSSMYDYDKNNLICYDMTDYYKNGEDRSKSYHVLISKQDGSVTREIFIPFETINTPIVFDGDRSVVGYFNHIRPSKGKWTLMEISSDTLYNYAPDGTLNPVIARTPPAHTMQPKIFLFMGIQTDRYYFMETVKNEFNFERGTGFYTGELMYDKEEDALFEFTVYNDDYAEKRTVAMTARAINHEIEHATNLDAATLVEKYRDGKLKDGKLKELVSKLDEDDNPVIMLVKQKR